MTRPPAIWIETDCTGRAGMTRDEFMRLAFPGEQYARLFPVEAAERRERINAAAKQIVAERKRRAA